MEKAIMIDQRKQALDRWVGERLGVALNGEMAASDAFFRRYFRYYWDKKTLIAMDAPPEQGSCDTFVAMARLLAASGIHVPDIIAGDQEQGFLLLSDLGRHTLLDVVDDSNADALLSDAIDTLIAIQQITCPADLPHYSRELLQAELALFPNWYVQRHLGVTLTKTHRRQLDQLFEQVIAQVLRQDRCFVHRDYMLRNLMAGSRVGVLDFQDATYGPISYDPVSLFKDAFISWPEERVNGWLKHYWLKARDANLPVPSEYQQFQLDCDMMGVQRHLKVIGIFARLHYRDGKSHYLQDVPRFFVYLQTVSRRRPELSTLVDLLEQVIVWQGALAS